MDLYEHRSISHFILGPKTLIKKHEFNYNRPTSSSGVTGAVTISHLLKKPGTHQPGFVFMLKILLVLILLLITLRLFLIRFEKINLYHPERQIFATPIHLKMPFEEVILKTTDGISLNGWYIPASSPTNLGRVTLLYCHGNAGNISHRLEHILFFHQLGLNTLIFDYRGYGKSEGAPSEKGTYQDAWNAYRYLLEHKKVEPSNVVIYGESLGAAIAIDLASQINTGALITLGAFTSTIGIGQDLYPHLPVKWMVRYRYDSIEKVSRVKIPYLLMHNQQDDIIPLAHGIKLFQTTQAPKEMFILPGNHHDGFDKKLSDVESRIKAFLKKYIIR
ncbi:MAG: alpha/beta hydrolase [Elusimicrobia bacterium]|nr:alpha/beta hydrolase [Elusimicrobiota bacterium]